MSIKAWLKGWVRLVGRTRPSEEEDGARKRGGNGKKWRGAWDPAQNVLNKAGERSDLPADAEAALTRYREALRALGANVRPAEASAALDNGQELLEQVLVPTSLKTAAAILRELLADCSDAVFRMMLIGGKRPAMLLYLEGMVSSERLELSVLEPLTQNAAPDEVPGRLADLTSWLSSVAVTINRVELVSSIGKAVYAALSGGAVLFVDGASQALVLGVPGFERRGVEEPISEPVIRGPRQGFVENLRTNTAMVRRQVKSPLLKMEQIAVGRRSRTEIAVIYLKDLANPELVAEVKARLERIEIDGIIESGMIEELIEDQPTSVFPQVMNTERPDIVAGNLLEGRVAILVDGSPFALIVPVTFWTFLQAGEDYYERFWMATAIRWLRYFFYFISLAAPSFYIAIVTFHQEMLPTALLMTIAATREGIPFPALVEAFMMEIFFEALREAGVRLPRPVGQAVSIVGALVIGQAAVQAGFISAPKVIIVAATGIASFTIPRYSFGLASRLLRFPLMILAGSMGLFGIMMGLIAILIHLCSLRSFGVPYLEPVSPIVWRDLRDVLVRTPIWLAGNRPASVRPLNRRRQAPWLRQGPGGGGS